jgi:hypothetical protein
MRATVPVILFGLLLASGCGTIHSIATGTAYQPYSVVTGGYSETLLAPDVARIVFRGNSSTSKERAQDLALLRAADLSRQAGFKYFTVLREQTDIAQVGENPAIFAPKSEIQVQFLNEKTPGVLVLDDNFLSDSLRRKYEIP